MSRLCRFDYLLSVLPALEPPGSIPPVTKQEFLHQVINTRGPVETVETILLSDDLIQRQALLSGEKQPDEVDLVLLAVSQGEGQAELPEFLMPEGISEMHEVNARLAVDDIWARYYLYAVSVARRSF